MSKYLIWDRFHSVGLKIGLTVFGFTMLLSLLSLQGCLFNARSKVSIPYQAVAVTGSPSSTLLGQLQFNILTYINIKVAISPNDADLIVEIIQDAPNSQIATYSGVGQITAYDLNDVVVFRVFDKVGNVLIPETPIYGVRSSNFSSSTVLAADIQQAQFIAEIRKELALQITFRLMALGRQIR